MSKPLRIAHLAMSALPQSIGGLQSVVDQLIRAQVSAGHEVFLVTRWQQSLAVNASDFPYRSFALPPQKSLSKTPFRSVEAKWSVAAAVRWHQLLRRFDFWHIHWLYPTAWLAHDTLRSMGIPALVTAHGADINVDLESGFGYRQFEVHDSRVKALAPKLNAVSAITPSAHHTLLDIGVREEAIFDIPNGVDANRLFQASGAKVRERLNIPAQSKIILSVGRNDPNKGFHHASDVLAELVSGGIDAVWLFVGKDTEHLRQSFNQRGLADRVRLCPPIEGKPGAYHSPPNELAEVYAAADILVSTSASEGFGLVLLEAMACNTAVIGFDAPGVRDVIAHGRDGLLCPHGDISAMSAAIASLLADEALLEQLARGGIEKAEHHGWPKIAARYLSAYKKIIEGVSD